MPRLTGSEQPRLFTTPLRPLTPLTSEGFDCIDFAETELGLTLLPWQRWLLIHGLELLPDGNYRFRYVLLLVARQNGKSLIGQVLALWWLYRKQRKLVLGMSTTLEYARDAWTNAVELAQDAGLPIPKLNTANGMTKLYAPERCVYRIAAANRRAGRSLTVTNLLADELREHDSWDAWSAASNAMNAVPDAQCWALTNAGDDSSIVLNHFRDAALAGEAEGWGIFEWSAPDGCEIDDRQAWGQANPSLGHTLTEATIAASMAQPVGQFRTEVLCQRVVRLDAAVDLDAWAEGVDLVGSMNALRDRVRACIDVAPDGKHVTLAVAGRLSDDRIRVEVAGAWDSVQGAREALVPLLGRINAKAVAWMPDGPAAVLRPDLAGVRHLQEIRGPEIAAACMGLADQISSRRILHNGDPLVFDHLAGAGRIVAGDGWRFSRRGGSHVDAAYAVAGAVHLVRATVRNLGRPRIVLPRAS